MKLFDLNNFGSFDENYLIILGLGLETFEKFFFTFPFERRNLSHKTTV